VDAPGQLAVTVGLMPSIGESEDIKQLRQSMEELTATINLLQPTVGNLQERVSQLEPEITNVTVQGYQQNIRINAIETSLKQAQADALQKCYDNCPKFGPKNEPITACKDVCDK